MKLKKMINERWLKTEEEKAELTIQEKKDFLESVAKFNDFGRSIYREHSLEQVVEQLKQLAERANTLTMQESDGWFDNVTIGRHMKGLGESVKLFEKTAKEVAVLQQRLESVYEDIGGTLSKYYNIDELQEELDPVGQEDSDIDNDGDSDASDQYLVNRRKERTKAIKGESKLSELADKVLNEKIGSDFIKQLKGKKNP